MRDVKRKYMQIVTEYDNVVLKNGLESPTMESRRKMELEKEMNAVKMVDTYVPGPNFLNADLQYHIS